jgi:Uncharacterized conserved protein
MIDERTEAKREAAGLEEPVLEARNLAKRLGLKPYDVRYWIVDHDEMNRLIAYDGFQRRYPHWRWGMKYDQQQKKDQHGLGKAFEIVNNDDPSHAFLQESNTQADQKAVITHVEAHGDFFANNRWYGMYANRGEAGPEAVARLERHAEAIQGYIEDPEIERADVERLIDAVLCLGDTIDQHRPLGKSDTDDEDGENSELADIEDQLDDLDLTDEVRDQVFDESWLEAQDAEIDLEDPADDVLNYLLDHGQRFDSEEGKAVDREPWESHVIEMLRDESYYFAAQKMTKVMNEGWAAFWESLMMSDEGFATDDELVTYADHMASVLGSPGLNPYKLGMELWQHVEVRAARRDVTERLLRIDGVTPTNFHDKIDFDQVRECIAPDPAIGGASPEYLDRLTELADAGDPRVDAENVKLAQAGEIDIERYPWKMLTYEGLAERHYALTRPQHHGAVERVAGSALQRQARYMFETDRYDSVSEALENVDYGAGWDRLYEVRESHNDVTFIDEFLTDEFVVEGGYFTYEYAHGGDEYRVASVDAEEVRKKLLLQFTNFGKPTVSVFDGNFDNRGELLLGHQYNGVALDMSQARATLERVFELWGRPVNLMTIRTEYPDHEMEIARRRDREPEGSEVGIRIRYDGNQFEEHPLSDELKTQIQAAGVDYDTKPDDWLA